MLSSSAVLRVSEIDTIAIAMIDRSEEADSRVLFAELCVCGRGEPTAQAVWLGADMGIMP